MIKKTILNLLFVFFITNLIKAQAPQGINYQAVLRNSVGALLQNQSVTLKFAIHQSSATGITAYEETQATITNNFGLVNLQIGQGVPTIGTFSTIPWGANRFFLEIQANTGTGFINLGTTQFVSVPYALYANASGGSPGAAFQAHLTSNFNLSPNIFYPVTFNSVDFNDGNNYNAGNGTFTAPDSGFYHFDATIIFTYPHFPMVINISQFGNNTVNLEGWTLEMGLYVDGNRVDIASSETLPQGSGIVGKTERIGTSLFLLPGQVVSVRVKCADNATCSVNGLLNWTQFSGFKVYSKH